MGRVVWKEGGVVSFSVKHDIRALAQMLRRPYLMMFDSFTKDDSWDIDCLEDVDQLFCSGVTKQFLTYSKIKKEPRIKPSKALDIPKCWIKPHGGSRWLTFWKGTPDEVEFCSLESRPGGSLMEKDITRGGIQEHPIIVEDIPLNDDIVDKYETTTLGTFPNLNERLYYCYLEGRNVDPEKDLQFDRPIDKKYKTMVDIWASKGSLKDWGFSIDKD